MAINIKYRSLKAFLLVVDSGSFSHAAERLGISQPSLSSLIKDLETILGVRLFERTTRSVALTDAGRELMSRAGRPVADLEEAYRSIADLSEVRRGAIVLGALPSTAFTLIPLALGQLRRDYPTLQTRIVEAHNTQLLSMLRTNQIECALATVPHEPPDLSFTPLVEDAFVAVFPADHPIAGHATLNWADLIPHDLILLSRGSSARTLYDQATGSDFVQPGVRYDVTNMVTAVSLVRQNLGITLMPRLALRAIDLGGLQYRPLSGAAAKRQIGFLHRKDRHLSPAAEVFFEQIVRTARSLE